MITLVFFQNVQYIPLAAYHRRTIKYYNRYTKASLVTNIMPFVQKLYTNICLYVIIDMV